MRAAAVQLNATEDTDRNRATADRLVREAAARGASLVVLPEKWTALGSVDLLRESAEPLDGPTVSWARAVAAAIRSPRGPLPRRAGRCDREDCTGDHGPGQAARGKVWTIVGTSERSLRTATRRA